MPIAGQSVRFLRSGAPDNVSQQPDPDLSLGGFNPDDVGFQGSTLYRQGTNDTASTVPYIVNDTQTDTPDSTDPAPGDWLTCVFGPGAPAFAKIIAVNYGTGDITLDRALNGLPGLNSTTIRNARKNYLFNDATSEQAASGYVDHRMIYVLFTAGSGFDNYRFYIEPVKPNGCDLEIHASGGWELNRKEPLIAEPGTEDPFTPLGVVKGKNGIGVTASNWFKADRLDVQYTREFAVPTGGSEVISDQEQCPIWIRRTLPKNAPPGECVFIIWCYVDDALAQDVTANPTPFLSGVAISWENPQPVYQAEISADRFVYTKGAARIIGTVRNDFGEPVEGLNCWITQESGPGSLAVDVNTFTDANGQVRALYTAPSTPSGDPTFRLNIPLNPEV